MDKGSTILIVDDDEDFRNTLSDLVGLRGYAPVALGEGRAALDTAEAESVAVAVIDLKLEDMSGLEVMKELKAASPDMECILLTGYASQESAIEAVNLGAYGYVQKPYDVKELLLEIQRAVEQADARRELRESRERYRDLIDNANDIIYTHDLEGNFTSANAAATRIYGYTNEEIRNLNIADIVDPEYLPLAQRKIREKLEGPVRTGPYELLTYDREGEPVWVEVSTRIVQRVGQPREVQGIARDITTRKLAEQALDKEREKFGVLVEQSPLGVSIIGQDGRYQYVNPKFVDIFGYTLEDIPTGREWFALAYPDEEHREEVVSIWIDDLKESEPGESRPRTFTVTCKDGSQKVIHFRPAMMESGEQFIFYEDVTEQKQAEETIKRLAYYDALTDLPNRSLFNKRLAAVLAHAERSEEGVAVMMLDLDRFKDINDTLGHSVGDELLKAVGQRLVSLLRGRDTVCRMGGDEFLLLLPDMTRPEDAEDAAQRILEAIREPFVLRVQELCITTSVGIAIYPKDGDDGDTLVRNADIAMYRAKEKGRDNYQTYAPS